jgi:hypothetical protein
VIRRNKTINANRFPLAKVYFGRFRQRRNTATLKSRRGKYSNRKSKNDVIGVIKPNEAWAHTTQ